MGGGISLALIIAGCCSITFMVVIEKGTYFFVSDSNTFIAVGLGISSFLYFKNIQLKYNKIINNIASATFGIFLIHTISDTMRRWLWKDILNVSGFYAANTMSAVVVHAILSVFGIFIVCMILDKLRERFIERPVFLYLSRFEWINKKIE